MSLLKKNKTMIKQIFRFNYVLIWVLISLFSNHSVSSQIRSSYDSLDISINNYIKENNIPGLLACVVKGNKVEWLNTYGFSNIENKVEMKPDAILNIASVSKLFTATAIMQLWEKDKINLKADINTYLPFSIRNPKFPNTPISIQQLLTHSSSIIDGSAIWESYSCGDPTISLEYWITNYFKPDGEFYNEKENFSENKPGSIDNYSNVGYGLLGYIVERVSGQPFNEYCNDNIFNPLEMVNSGWLISEIDIANHITPYVYMSDDLRDDMANHFNHLFPGESEFQRYTNIATCLYSCSNYPDGYVRTSIIELSHFLIACMNNGEYQNKRILKKQTLDLILSPQTEINKNTGLGWHKENIFWGHNGSDPGVQTELFFNPETKIGIIIIQNSLEGESFDILKSIYNVVSADKK
jgi:CubicO group peptidase (beta-lactamase class C family)